MHCNGVVMYYNVPIELTLYSYIVYGSVLHRAVVSDPPPPPHRAWHMFTPATMVAMVTDLCYLWRVMSSARLSTQVSARDAYI